VTVAAALAAVVVAKLTLKVLVVVSAAAAAAAAYMMWRFAARGHIVMADSADCSAYRDSIKEVRITADWCKKL
jgi:hypothetical protein